MSQSQDGIALRPMDFADLAVDAPAAARAAFVRRTYLHLAGAIVAFMLLELVFFAVLPVERIAAAMVGGYSWLLVLGAYMAVSWVADRWARAATSPGKQYLGLGVYVVAEAAIFLPLLCFARNVGSADVIPTAAILTTTLFAALTTVVFATGKDFSFLRSILVVGGFVALGLIVCSIIFGFTLGLAFSGGMILLASAAILYSTSNIIHHYRTDQHVSAALGLFAAVALLFWYVLQFLLQYTSND